MHRNVRTAGARKAVSIVLATGISCLLIHLAWARITRSEIEPYRGTSVGVVWRNGAGYQFMGKDGQPVALPELTLKGADYVNGLAVSGVLPQCTIHLMDNGSVRKYRVDLPQGCSVGSISRLGHGALLLCFVRGVSQEDGVLRLDLQTGKAELLSDAVDARSSAESRQYAIRRRSGTAIAVVQDGGNEDASIEEVVRIPVHSWDYDPTMNRLCVSDGTKVLMVSPGQRGSVSDTVLRRRGVATDITGVWLQQSIQEVWFVEHPSAFGARRHAVHAYGYSGQYLGTRMWSNTPIWGHVSDTIPESVGGIRDFAKLCLAG